MKQTAKGRNIRTKYTFESVVRFRCSAVFAMFSIQTRAAKRTSEEGRHVFQLVFQCVKFNLIMHVSSLEVQACSVSAFHARQLLVFLHVSTTHIFLLYLP